MDTGKAGRTLRVNTFHSFGCGDWKSLLPSELRLQLIYLQDKLIWDTALPTVSYFQKFKILFLDIQDILPGLW